MSINATEFIINFLCMKKKKHRLAKIGNDKVILINSVCIHTAFFRFLV